MLCDSGSENAMVPESRELAGNHFNKRRSLEAKYSTVVCVRRRAGGGDTRPDAGCEKFGKVPQKLEVPIQVHADRSCRTRRRLGVAIFAPAAVGGLVLGHAVEVAQGHEDYSC
jgi:hypothetical protein